VLDASAAAVELAVTDRPERVRVSVHVPVCSITPTYAPTSTRAAAGTQPPYEIVTVTAAGAGGGAGTCVGSGWVADGVGVGVETEVGDGARVGVEVVVGALVTTGDVLVAEAVGAGVVPFADPRLHPASAPTRTRGARSRTARP